jgi:Skp family chaperone for outer membrane proteins
MPQPILSKILAGDRQKQQRASEAQKLAESEHAKQTARYNEILRDSHIHGDADADELRKLIDILGITANDVESDLQILAMARETAASLGELPERHLDAVLAKLSVERHFAEMQRFWKSGKTRTQKLNDLLNLRESELHALESDATALRELRKENPELLGGIGAQSAADGFSFPDLLRAYAAKHMADMPQRFIDRFLRSPEWVNFHELEFKLRDEYEAELDAGGGQPTADSAAASDKGKSPAGRAASAEQ